MMTMRTAKGRLRRFVQRHPLLLKGVLGLAVVAAAGVLVWQIGVTEVLRFTQRHPVLFGIAAALMLTALAIKVVRFVLRRPRVAVALTGPLVLAATFVGALWMEVPSRAQFRRLAADKSYATPLTDREGRPLGLLYEERLADGSYAPQSGAYVPLDSLPAWFAGDLKAIEGWSDYGVSVSGLARAMYKWQTEGKRAGGASTITMQTYRLLTGHTEDTKFRKLCEVVGALKLSLTFSEEQILELYINNIHWANEGAHNGLGYAARRLFSKAPGQLTRSEALVLITGLASPSRSRQLQADTVGRGLKAGYRRRVDLLEEKGRLTETQRATLRDSLPAPNRQRVSATSYGVFLDRVVEELEWMLGPTAWSLGDGLVVETTLDRAANDSAAAALARPGALPAEAKGSFLLLNRESEVVVYATGRRSLRGHIDLIASERTMPSSRFKVLVYTLLAEQMLAAGASPEQVLARKLPTTYRVNERFVVDDELAEDSISCREALVRSKNAPVYYIVNELLGPRRIKRFASRLQMPGIEAAPSIGMGSMGVSELNLAAAYAALFARNGFYRRPSFIRTITARDGRVIYDGAAHALRQREPQLAGEEAAHLVKQVMRESVYKSAGTSKRLLTEAPGLEVLDVASKTGTSPNASPYRYRGLTGVVGPRTFSATVQGEYLGGSASTTAVPLAATVLERLQSGGFLQ